MLRGGAVFFYIFNALVRHEVSLGQRHHIATQREFGLSSHSYSHSQINEVQKLKFWKKVQNLSPLPFSL